MNRFILTLTILAFSLPSNMAHAQSPTSAAPSNILLRGRDRVVFYGDSITAQRLYTRFLEDIAVSRYPSLQASFFNAGVSGDTVAGGTGGDWNTRLSRDVLAVHPTLVTVMLGMNDGRYRTDHPEDLAQYRTGYAHLLDLLQTHLPGATILVIKPSPYDEVAHEPKISGYNQRLREFGAAAEELAHFRNMPVCDLNTPIEDALRKAMAIDPVFAASFLPDRIHPSEAGHWLLALALARCMGIKSTISETTLDFATLQVVSNSRVTVSDVRADEQSLTWTAIEESLPLPLELASPTTPLLDRISTLSEDEQELLRVRHLPAAAYRLLIDEKEVGRFSRDELEAGVNLALRSTPMQTQARAIDWKVDSRTKLSATRFNLLTASPSIKKAKTAISALDQLDRRMEAAEWVSAQPRAHRFELEAGS